jgi:hypothetical protein
MMGTYVDDPIWPLGRMLMCHLVADTLEELHEMADKVGVARRHFQNGSSFPHYDICKAKREIAVSHGAKPVTRRELVVVMRRFRDHHPNWRRR